MIYRKIKTFQVGEVVTTIPTIGFNVEQVEYKNLKFQVRSLMYYDVANGLTYIED